MCQHSVDETLHILGQIRTHHPYLVMGGCHSDVTMTVVFVHTEVFVSACNHSSYEG